MEPPGRPYVFIDFRFGKDAARARNEMYINDENGERRNELGDRNIEISFKNSYTPRPFKKGGTSFQDIVQK